MKILHKILMIIFIPMILLIYFAYDLASTKIENLNNIQKSFELTSLTEKLSSIIHNLNDERRLSVQFIYSKGQGFQNELNQSFNNSDKSIKDLNDYLKKSELKSLDSNDQELENSIKNISDKINEIENERLKIKNLSTNSKKIFKSYSDINDSIFNAIEYISSIDQNSELSSMKLAYMKMLSVQENIEEERIIIIDFLEKRKFDKKDYADLILSTDNEKNNLSSYISFATNKQEDYYKNKENDQSFVNINNLITTLINEEEKFNFNNDLASINNLFNSKISIIHNIVDKINDDIIIKSNSLKSSEINKLIFSLIVVLIITIISAIAIYLITRSITQPLNESVKISEKISEGNLDVNFQNKFSKDETGQLLSAMQKMIHYINEIAVIAEKIAEGDINININPKSQKDKLNNSFLKTVKYINNVAHISEKISDNDLLSDVTPISEKDILNKSLRKMINNLQMTVEKLYDSVAIISTASEQLTSTSIEISARAEEQSSATHEISTTLLQMSTSIGVIEKNTNNLLHNVEETSTAIEEMSYSINTVSKNTALLSDLTNNSLTTIQEMAASIEEVSVNSLKISNSSEQFVIEAKDGEKVIKNTIKSMYDFSDSMKSIENAISKLNDSNKEINSITDVIKDISDQTNLLALNAAIEAARAGEHGKGFAVVAAEIRKLAEKSTSYTKDIIKIINGIQIENEAAIEVTKNASFNAKEGAEQATKAGTTLDKLIRSIEKNNEMVKEISYATENQTKSNMLIVNNVKKMADMALQVDIATKQQAMASVQIKESSDSMNRMANQVAISISEQKLGSEQIVKAIDSIAQTSTHNMNSSYGIVEASGNLKNQAEIMKNFVSKFKVNNNKDLILRQ